jgi:hypothetical protein
MFRKRSSTVLLGLLLFAASAAAQVNVTLQLPFAQMPARVSEWRENESLILIVVQNTGREQYEGLMLSVELSKDGWSIARSRDGHPAQPRFSLGPGETRSLSWREVISEEAVEYDGSIRQQVIATGELPEGQYQLCIRILDAQLRPRSQQVCAPFTIVLPDPPQLLSPIGGAEVSPMPLLQWTPSNPTAPGLQYQVTVKVRYRGQTPAQAMASNPVRLQATVPTTSYQVPVTEQLGVDAADPSYAGHVWQVQALLNGRPYGRNRGLSQIEWFVVSQMAVDTVKPSGGRPIAVVEWEVPYEEICPGRPIKLQMPPIQEDTVLYVLRVRVPEKLSLQQLEQLRKNWAHEVRKEISTMRERRDVPLESVRTSNSIDHDVESSSYRMVDSTRKPRGVPYILVDHGRAFHTHQDTFGVQSYPPKYVVGYYLEGTPQDTAGAGKEISTMRPPRGRVILDAVVDESKSFMSIISRLRPHQDTFVLQYYGRRDPVILGQNTAGAGKEISTMRPPRGRVILDAVVDESKSFMSIISRLRPHQDTFVLQYYGRRDPVILGQDTAGAGVDRTRYTGGYFLYALPQDTTKPAELVDYYVPNGTPQDTAGTGVDRTRYTGGFFLYGMGQDTIPPTTSALVPPTYTVWTTQPIGYPVEGGIVLGEFTPTYVGLPGPFPESISADVRWGTQGEIVVTFTQLH